MASEIFNDKNAVFKKLKGKSENKVCFYNFFYGFVIIVKNSIWVYEI